MATIATLGLLVFSTIGTLLAAPSSYHDQRQNGQYNLHARLDNFIVVLIPRTSLFDSSWLDFVKRANLQDHLKHVKKDKAKPQDTDISIEEDEEDDGDDDERWVPSPEILSKNPYTVDVEIKSQPSPLSRLHPVPILDISSDVMIALSPSVSLSKSSEPAEESPKTSDLATKFVKTPVKLPIAPEKAGDLTEASHISLKVPKDDESKTSARVPEAPEEVTKPMLQPLEVMPLEEPARTVKKSKSIISTTLERIQKAPKSMDPDKLTDREKELRLRLIGVGIEVCEPNEQRAEDGNCVPIKPRQRSGQYFASSGHLPALRFGLSPANE